MSEPAAHATLLARYRAMLASGEFEPDAAQALAIEQLQILANRLAEGGRRE